MKNQYKCPVCGTTEVYLDGFTVCLDKYDSIDPGNYECVNGHKWTVEVVRNYFEDFTVENVKP